MAEGARLALEISGCDFLDINMGCPMPKIANSGDGCGLMRTPELAEAIVRAVSQAVDVPVTVKCRLGWDKGSINVLDFTKRMEQSGARHDRHPRPHQEYALHRCRRLGHHP